MENISTSLGKKLAGFGGGWQGSTLDGIRLKRTCCLVADG
jgi:hypothetical protein